MLSLADSLLRFTMSCREDVVSLPNGVFANVLHLWEEVCRQNHATCVGIKKGTLQRPLQRD
jgi:hypothetical protein